MLCTHIRYVNTYVSEQVVLYVSSCALCAGMSASMTTGDCEFMALQGLWYQLVVTIIIVDIRY